ncbi:sigma-54-dependent Fis family transcriptional regulator [Mesoterricola silvestris]|uniref:Sigma-54-dependent Fis family transcriptional regulator n=1 Tax=Mesoterricola silvestris TaxID=2927979 RepID=A0AA48GVW5_9BACT|nr:sigma-54-dependent Fis family transcriptional regulator [Mesoterricola silvestris]BDU72796.1 sigma-54-dependent Fis family transcriptional regulator [Mesoterricola silvestris]
MPTSGSTDSAAIRRARFLFLERGEVPPWLPGPLVSSWQRCAVLGVPHERPEISEPVMQREFRLARERSETLLGLAATELDALGECMEDTPGLVLLTDADGMVLERRGNLDFLQKAEQVALQPGVNWSEQARGTNAIGTALTEHRSVLVRGCQHFCQSNEILTCSAVPVLTPTGEMAGVLDISSDPRLAPGYARGLIQMAVAQIEHRWFSLDLRGRRMVTLHANPALLGTWQEAILLFEEDVLVAANRVAITLLGLEWGSLRHVRYAHLFAGAMPEGLVVAVVMRDGRKVFARSFSQKPPAVAVPEPDRGRAVPGDSARRVPRGRSAADPDPERRRGPAGIYWDAASREQLNLAVRAVNAGVPVMILGETGTGKELFTRALHAASKRGHRNLVMLNCAAIPEGLIESELFGYEDGAFTGARQKGSPGKIKDADGGILFLDEIGDMPLSMQARLLRVLQSKEVAPLGGSRAAVVDFVPVCATHRNLEAEVAAGRMRQDLFYRLHHFCVRLTPLRERPDFPVLLDTLLQGSGAGERGIDLAPEARAVLQAHTWPGNLRELANLLRTLVALADDGTLLGVEDLPPEYRRPPSAPAPAPPPPAVGPLHLDALTRQAVEQAIAANKGNMTAAAKALGLHRSTLYRMLGRPKVPGR